MFVYTRLCAVILLLMLTACLKVTGEAKDQFDLEDEEVSKLDFGNINVFPRKKNEAQAENNADKPVATEKLINTPPSPASVSDEQDYSNFLKWKEARDSDSVEYQEFKEYQEYLSWLEFQKLKNK